MIYFTNNQINSTLLPKAEEVLFHPIERDYWTIVKWILGIAWSIILLAGIALLLFIPSLQKVVTVFGILLPILTFSFLNFWLVKKSFDQKAYALREKDLVYKSGWRVQRISVCPLNRIQHCNVSSGPLERKLGLASLSVFTAGTEGSDLKIPGLTITKANEIRDFIMKQINTNEQSDN